MSAEDNQTFSRTAYCGAGDLLWSATQWFIPLHAGRQPLSPDSLAGDVAPTAQLPLSPAGREVGLVPLRGLERGQSF